MPASRASRAAVSSDMITSPKRFGLICPKGPSCIGNAITFVGPDRPKYLLLSLAISGSFTMTMDSSPSRHSKALKIVFAFPFISSWAILYRSCLSSIRISIDLGDPFGILDSVMVDAV